MIIARRTARYGYKRDRLDRRDHMFTPSAQAPITGLGSELKSCLPPVLDQGQTNACTGHGIIGAMRTVLIRDGLGDKALSRLQAYYDARRYEGTTAKDDGAQIRDVVRGVAWLGAAPEELWPFDPERITVKPSAEAYAAALKFEISYERVGRIDGTAAASDVKAALAERHPVVFGFNVFKQFESDACAQSGVIEMPAADEDAIGGHCTFLWDYVQRDGYFTGRNSWGPDWGDKGDFYAPNDFVEQQGSDFWAITKVRPA